jgi:hypothetical protein
MDNEVQEEQKEEVQEEQQSSLDSLDSKELVSMIKELRSEAKKYRLAKSEAQSQLDAIKAKENKAKEEDLKKKGDYEKLLLEKESLIEQLNVKAKAYDDYYNAEIENIKTVLGDNWEDEFTNLSLGSLKKLTAIKAVEKKVEVDNPTGSPKKKVDIELDEADKKEAEFMFPNFMQQEAYDAYKEIKIKKLQLKKKET